MKSVCIENRQKKEPQATNGRAYNSKNAEDPFTFPHIGHKPNEIRHELSICMGPWISMLSVEMWRTSQYVLEGAQPGDTEKNQGQLWHSQ
jgi:hypothetical protein